MGKERDSERPTDRATPFARHKSSESGARVLVPREELPAELAGRGESSKSGAHRIYSRDEYDRSVEAYTLASQQRRLVDLEIRVERSEALEARVRELEARVRELEAKPIARVPVVNIGEPVRESVTFSGFDPRRE
jgi:hypothetical protein